MFGTKIDFARLFVISVIHISPRVSSPGKKTSSIRGQLWHKANSRSLLKTTDRQLNEPCNCGRAHYGNEPVGLRQLMVRSASGNGIAVGIMIRVIDIVVGIMSRVIDIVVGIMSRVIGTVMPFPFSLTNDLLYSSRGGRRNEAPSGEKSELANVLYFKPGLGQNIAQHASPAAKDVPFWFLHFQLIQLHLFSVFFQLRVF